MPDEIKCPKCGSNQITANKKGFSGTQAVGGAILTGGIGLLAGTIGSNKVKITCLSCGNEFKPGEDLVGLKRKRELENQMYKSKGFWIFFIALIMFFIWLFI